MGKSKRSSLAGETSTPNKKTTTFNNDASSSITLNNGFLTVPISIPSKLSKSVGEVKHWIYVRKHTNAPSSVASSSKLADELPAERTLFVANLPVDTTESHLREIFSKAAVNVSTIRFRKGAVKMKDEEEDEKEELAEGEDASASEDEEVEEQHLTAVQEGKGRKKGKKGGQMLKKSRAPKVVPLPDLDPRKAMGSQGFLSTSSSAHIVFLDINSFDRALELLTKNGGLKWIDPFKSLRKEAEKQALLDSDDSPKSAARVTTSASFLLNHGAGIPPTGLEFLLHQYTSCRPSMTDIQQWANSRISLYQYRKAHPLPRKIGVRGVTVGPSGELLDEDGFIIVQRTSGSGGGKYGRVGASAEGGGSVGVAKAGFVENKKKKSKGLEDFYRFQLREKKREQLADLRAKFEADKAKVAQLKAGRRFKPY